jgi:hypothetical protein
MKITPRRALASLAASVAVVLIASAVNAFAFFLANQMKAELIGQVFDYFLPAELFLLVLVFVAALFGGFRNRWFTLGSGVVASLIAGMVGVLIRFASQPLDGVPAGVLFGAVFGRLWSSSWRASSPPSRPVSGCSTAFQRPRTV